MAVAAAGSWCRFALERTAKIDTRSMPLLAGARSGAGRSRCRCADFSHALTSSDLFMNLCFGALRANGQSPYAALASSLGDSPFLSPVISERWIHEPSPYGPLFHRLAALAVGAGRWSASPWWGSFWAFKAMMLACVVAALAIAAQHLSATRTGAAGEVFVVLALGPLIAWELSGQGHNDALLLLFLVAFWAVPFDPFTTVATNVWAAGRLWSLLNDASIAAVTLPAHAEPVLADPEPALAGLA